MEFPNTMWHSLKVSGLPLAWLDCIHGFAAQPLHAPPLDSAIEICALAAPDMLESSAPAQVLATEFVRAQLQSGAPATLFLRKDIPVGNPRGLMPLTAALAQQWLLGGFLSLHAAVLQWQGRTLMVLGDSHAGKSTLVRGALQIGARVLSDDLVRISLREAAFFAHSLRGFVRFRGDQFSPETMIWIRPGDARFAARLALDGIVFLQAADGARDAHSQTESISLLDATAQLINQSAPLFLQNAFPIERQLLLNAIAALLKALPRIRARTGLDVVHAPQQAFAILTEALWPNA
jgi:hypothetical protein